MPPCIKTDLTICIRATPANLAIKEEEIEFHVGESEGEFERVCRFAE